MAPPARPAPASEGAWTAADAETREPPGSRRCRSPYTAAEWRYRHSWHISNHQKERSRPSAPCSCTAPSATESMPPFSSRCFHPFHIIMKQMNYIKKAIPVQDACTRRMRTDVCFFTERVTNVTIPRKNRSFPQAALTFVFRQCYNGCTMRLSAWRFRISIHYHTLRRVPL